MTTTQTERAFTDAVLELAKLYNWRTAHFRPGLNRRGQWSTPVAGDGAGFPDLVLVRDGHLLFVELKTEKGRLSPAQVAWQDALLRMALIVAGDARDPMTRKGCIEHFVWKPSDWEAIVARLQP